MRSSGKGASFHPLPDVCPSAFSCAPFRVLWWHLSRVSLWKISPQTSTSENGSEMTPGPLGEDPGLSRPVQMHSSRRETPSSALAASNARARIRRSLLKGSLSEFPVGDRPPWFPRPMPRATPENEMRKTCEKYMEKNTCDSPRPDPKRVASDFVLRLRAYHGSRETSVLRSILLMDRGAAEWA